MNSAYLDLHAEHTDLDLYPPTTTFHEVSDWSMWSTQVQFSLREHLFEDHLDETSPNITVPPVFTRDVDETERAKAIKAADIVVQSSCNVEEL